MIDLKQVTLVRGQKVLLENASVRLEHGYRVGLIGRNGAGKSSVFALLRGQLHEDAGTIVNTWTEADVAYLEQSLPQCDETALAYVKKGDREWHTVSVALAQAEADEDGLVISDCHLRMAEIEGYDIDSRAAKILIGLGFSHEQHQLPITDFSGGWQMRLQLARVLISRADLLMLDEPTNHLDIDAILWLEQWLSQLRSTVVVISHDRDFLDNVTTHTVHLSQQRLRLYVGGYSAFTKQYELQMEIESRALASTQQQREHLQSFVDRFRYKASKAKQAQSRIKALEKLTFSPTLQRESPFHFSFLPCAHANGSALIFSGAVGYDGDVIVDDVRFNLDYGDRVGLIGRNGEGKSTLVKTFTGDIDPVSGEMHRHVKMNMAYFSQQQVEQLDGSSTPLQQLFRIDPKIRESDARKYLGGFDFSSDRVFDSVEVFSGGEKARLALALLIYQRPNVLFLDEPTNHMDMQMREAFVIALQNYSGAVVLVSHDRYFMSGVVDEVWLVAGKKLTRLPGDLVDYKQAILTCSDPTAMVSEAEEAMSVEASPSQPKPKPKPKPQTQTQPQTQSSPAPAAKRIDNKRVRRLESKMDKLNQSIAEVESELSDARYYDPECAEEMNELVHHHHELKEQLAVLEAQWLEAMGD